MLAFFLVDILLLFRDCLVAKKIRAYSCVVLRVVEARKGNIWNTTWCLDLVSQLWVMFFTRDFSLLHTDQQVQLRNHRASSRMCISVLAVIPIICNPWEGWPQGKVAPGTCLERGQLFLQTASSVESITTWEVQFGPLQFMMQIGSTPCLEM